MVLSEEKEECEKEWVDPPQDDMDSHSEKEYYEVMNNGESGEFCDKIVRMFGEFKCDVFGGELGGGIYDLIRATRLS